MKKTLYTLFSVFLAFSIKMNAQEYHLGQVVENPDGSRGVVFYLNEEGTDGWMVALHDASTNCFWGPDGSIEGLDNIVVGNDYLSTVFLDHDGYENTQKIRDHFESIGYTGSYAAGLVDFENGWYLPAAGQLKMLYVNAIFYEPALESVGEAMGLHPYLSSSVKNGENAWFVHFGATYPLTAWAWNGYLSAYDRMSYTDPRGDAFAVRAVRNLDFSPLPFISQLQAPSLICGEGPLELVLPHLGNADAYGWEIASDPSFSHPIAYEGQDLNEAFNGWYLRVWASNGEGTTYSNSVSISVHSPSQYQFSVQTCNPPFVWNGTPYDQSGTIQQVFNNQWGCDSIVTIALTVGHDVDYQFMDIGCGEYEWNGQVYTESGPHQQSFLTSDGCDSIVTLNLTIKPAPVVSEIHGETDIYYRTYGEFHYRIDSVPGALGYAWYIDNPWTLSSSFDSPECSVDVSSIDKATLSVRVFTECGFEERHLLIRHDREPGFTVFPNPTVGDLTITLYGMKGKAVLRVYDMLGNLVSHDEVDTDVHGLSVPYNLKGKAAGIYYFTVVNDYDVITKKVVKTTATSYGIYY